MKLSDFVFDFLKKKGTDTVFTLTGGGIMHLVDSLGRSGIEYVCCHHEQAASIAAQAYGMHAENPGICLVTTGPGGINALTGTAAAYVDSTPVIYISGQVKRSDFASKRGVRQYGAQENDIISMASPVTKYAALLLKPDDVLYELEKCWYTAVTGRKGPVWIDIPLDVQAAEIDADSLRHYEQPQKKYVEYLPDAVQKTKELLNKSKRPIILLGQGVVSSGAVELVRQFVEKNSIPVLTTWRMLDFTDSNDKLFFGSPGLQALRYSNIIIQHCDALIVLGSRLDNMITAFNEQHFAFRAEKIVVDIDENELKKLALTNMYPVQSDIKTFMQAILSENNECLTKRSYADWIKRCRNIKKAFPILYEKQDVQEAVNLYQVTEEISKNASAEDIIVISSTSRCNTAGHIAFEHKRGQKTISSMGMGSMGFALPSITGAYFAGGKKKRIIAIEGDGSLQLNIQELQTIVSNKIDAKIFIFNNQGYSAITTMQDRNFGGFYVGSNKQSGLSMPKLDKIAKAYGIPCYKIETAADIKNIVIRTMRTQGPVLCEIVGSLYFDEIPKCISSIDKDTGQRISAALENPYPFLTEEKMLEITSYLLGEEEENTNGTV